MNENRGNSSASSSASVFYLIALRKLRAGAGTTTQRMRSKVQCRIRPRYVWWPTWKALSNKESHPTHREKLPTISAAKHNVLMRSGLSGRLFAVFSSAKSVTDRERQCTLQADTQIGGSGRACISKRWSGGEVEDFQEMLSERCRVISSNPWEVSLISSQHISPKYLLDQIKKSYPKWSISKFKITKDNSIINFFNL